MDRSPRRAGAAGARALRSFAISMAIAVAATQTRVHGFTIRGRQTTVDPASDLTGEASSLLEVKYEVALKDAKPINVERNDGELRTEVIAINKTQHDHSSNETRYDLLQLNLNDSSQYNKKSAVNDTVLSIVENKDINNRTVIAKEEKKQSIREINETTTHNTRTKTNIAADNEVGSEILKNVNLVIASTDFDYVTTESVATASEADTILYGENTETSSLSSDGSTALNAASSGSTSSYYMYELDMTNTASISSDSYPTSSYTDISESTTYASTPTWKTFTTIDRKSATTTGDGLKNPDNDNMLKSETAQTRITLENMISVTPIPSLENLRQNFTSMNDNHITTTIQEAYDISGYLNGVSSTSAQNMSTEAALLKIGVVSSRRGGYLDNSGTLTPHSIEATTVQIKKDITSFTETFGALFKSETNDSDVPGHENASRVDSQSQLAEHAIKEELLKEETISDNKENANRYSDEGVKLYGDERNKSKSQTAAELTPNDIFSVKPIITDKKINTSLYAVNPNYKPLKKIDVQPPKQFVRDPDDNSWRNESISSLGIVFKPKNSSISFTQVLKNKTETELNNTSDKDNKVPDLRVRLEKMAEVRKSKKKKINLFGEVVYTDYDSGENTNPPTNENKSPATSLLDPPLTATTLETPTATYNVTVSSVNKEKIDIFNIKDLSLFTTTKPKKYFNIAEYYDTTDEYDADYMKVTKIDLQKFTKPITIKDKSTTSTPEAVYPTQLSNYLPERRPTVQYFPPTKKVTPKMNVQIYDTNYQSKMDLYTYRDDSKNVLPVSYGTSPPSRTDSEPSRVTTKPEFTPVFKQNSMDKNLYLTHPPGVAEPPRGYTVNDGNFNRASYVIKHYKDFINEAIKDSDEDRNNGYLPFTETPMSGVTINDLAKLTEKYPKTPEEDYEYEMQYRKDLINRFVDNFNQNSDRFKVDFPVLYNNSVVHGKIATDSGRVLAASGAYLASAVMRAGAYASNSKPCEPNCDKVNVDLSPDYELHYYVPEQEEKEEIGHDHRHVTVPYHNRNTQL